MRLIEGDALTRLRELPSESVDCCITSPPYWGLRDYGTATWEGGGPGCDHTGLPMRTNNKPTDHNGKFHGGVTRAAEFYRDICGKCGAVRIDAQLGMERQPEEYVSCLVEVFREVRRVLRDDGTAWINLGDSYTGSANAGGELTRTCNGPPNARDRNLPRKYGVGLKPKDLCGIPWRVAFALQADGWYLRQDLIWHKPNPMPESVQDRCTKAHEYLFLLSKSQKYYYDADAIAEKCSWSESWSASNTHTAIAQGGRHGSTSIFNQRWQDSTGKRNRRSVWTLATLPTPDAHFATFPIELPETCLLAGSRPGGIVLDPFSGAGTTGLAAIKHGRDYIGIELNPKYIEISRNRLERHMPLLAAAI